MGFNKGYEFRKFQQQWEKEKKWMQKAGMRDEAIEEMYHFDRMYFNSRRRYEEHRVTGQFLQYVSIEEDFEQNSHLLDLITDKKLYIAMSQLKPSELELLELFIVKGFNVTEIAHLKNRSKSTISAKLNRVINKIKKIYKNPNKKH